MNTTPTQRIVRHLNMQEILPPTQAVRANLEMNPIPVQGTTESSQSLHNKFLSAQALLVIVYSSANRELVLNQF
jgi:hypothetical protein